jgi:hypothetical protein
MASQEEIMPVISAAGTPGVNQFEGDNTSNTIKNAPFPGRF